MSQMSIDFNKGYSYETSLPAYYSNSSGKLEVEALVYNAIRFLCFQNKEVCLLMIQEYLYSIGHNVEQGRISARVNTLIKKDMVVYEGQTFYKEMKRKKIVLKK